MFTDTQRRYEDCVSYVKRARLAGELVPRYRSKSSMQLRLLPHALVPYTRHRATMGRDIALHGPTLCWTMLYVRL